MSATAVKADFYEVLSVSRDCSEQELKAAYRKQAMQYHPDRNPNNPAAEEKFKACSEAYQVLSDPEKRAAYDRYGHAAFGGGAPGGNPFAGAGFQGDLGDIFGDLFGEMFNTGGQGRRGSRTQRGRDLRYDLELEFEEAVFGAEKEIRMFDAPGATVWGARLTFVSSALVVSAMAERLVRDRVESSPVASVRTRMRLLLVSAM